MKQAITAFLITSFLVIIAFIGCSSPLKTSDNADDGLTEIGLQIHYYDVVSKFIEPMQYQLRVNNIRIDSIAKVRTLTGEERRQYDENLDKYLLLLDIQKQAINYKK